MRATVRRWMNVLQGGLFLLAIALPLLWQTLGQSRSAHEETENRHAAELPRLEFSRRGPILWPTRRSLRDFPEKFEAWHNDHFGFRRELNQSYTAARLAGLTPEALTRVSMRQRPSCPIVVGLGGWLYYSGETNLDTYRWARPFDDRELDGWVQRLRQRREWLARRGAAYVLMFPPAKPRMYPEHLPRSLTRVGQVSRLDQLLDALARDGQFTVVDPRPALESAKRQRDTYYKTDEHWNNFGAFVGYQELMQGMRRSFPGLRVPTLDEVELRESTRTDGDLAKILDPPFALVDDDPQLAPRLPRRAQMRYVDSSQGLVGGLISQRGDGELGSVVVLHDSFFNRMRDWFSEHAQRVRYQRTHAFPHEMIEQERPILVVQEITERYLGVVIPENPPAVEAIDRERMARSSTSDKEIDQPR